VSIGCLSLYKIVKRFETFAREQTIFLQCSSHSSLVHSFSTCAQDCFFLCFKADCRIMRLARYPSPVRAKKRGARVSALWASKSECAVPCSSTCQPVVLSSFRLERCASGQYFSSSVKWLFLSHLGLLDFVFPRNKTGFLSLWLLGDTFKGRQIVVQGQTHFMK
jgi:hypothetical protein